MILFECLLKNTPKNILPYKGNNGVIIFYILSGGGGFLSKEQEASSWLSGLSLTPGCDLQLKP